MMIATARTNYQPEAIHPPSAGYKIPSGDSKYEALILELNAQAKVVGLHDGNHAQEGIGNAFPAVKLQTEINRRPLDLSAFSIGRVSPVIIDHNERKIDAHRKFEDIQRGVAEIIAQENFPRNARLRASAVKDIMWTLPAHSKEKAALQKALQPSIYPTPVLPIAKFSMTPEVQKFHDFIEKLPPHERRGYLESKFIELSRENAQGATMQDKKGYAAVMKHFGGLQFSGAAEKLIDATTTESAYRLGKELRSISGDSVVREFASLMADRLSGKVTPSEFVKTAIHLMEDLAAGTVGGRDWGRNGIYSVSEVNIPLHVPLIAVRAANPKFAAEVDILINP